ncbi:MAG: BlaI/MecI/CopY family transcriptional regulator, partial [SAR202 cluster bacterium]|nr:BlaI/MecI/CopY family transcriptional regulator [SAR202 cluster bacterium]
MTSIQASAPPQLKPSRTGGRTLGSLESRLMNTLWDSSSELTVQEVCDRLGGRNYKTIMTVLNRLVDKGMLVRQLHGRAFRYLPRMNRNAFLRGAADDIVENYVQSFGPQAIPHMTAALAAVASQPGHQPAAAEHHDNVIPFRPAAL